MVRRQRFEPFELKVLKQLKPRMNFSEKDWNNYYKLSKGFEGEIQFDKWMETLSKDWIIVNDLLLEINDSIVQIDSILIINNKLYPFEVKNYEGDYYYENGRINTLSGLEIKSPLQQLERNENLLRRLLQDLRINTSIESYVCFINPHFHLYQSPQKEPIIFHPQLSRFIKNLNSITCNNIQRSVNIAEKLVSLHQTNSPYKRKLIPDYEFDSLIKGIFCKSCFSQLNKRNDDILLCEQCGLIESVEAAIFRSVEEFILLFPKKKMTTTAIYDWCNGIKSKRTIRRMLLKKYSSIGSSKDCYFVYS